MFLSGLGRPRHNLVRPIGYLLSEVAHYGLDLHGLSGAHSRAVIIILNFFLDDGFFLGQAVLPRAVLFGNICRRGRQV